MTDRLERDLTTLFHDKASDTAASPVPLNRLVSEGEAAMVARRRRTRMVAVGAVAAAVVLAVAIPLGLRSFDGDSTPAPADIPEVVNTSTERPDSVADLPTGPPPAVPYAVNQVIHFQGEEYDVPMDAEGFPGPDDEFRQVGGAVLLVDQTTVPAQENQMVRLHLTEDGEFSMLADIATYRNSGFSDGLTFSDDGSTIATVAKTGDEASRVTTHAVPTGDEIGNVEVSARRLDLIGVDGDGRVHWTADDDVFVWERGQDPRRVELPAESQVLGLASSSVLLADGRRLVHGTVTDDGEFVERGSTRLPADEGRIYVMDGAFLQWKTALVTGSVGGGRGDGPGAVTDVVTGQSTELLVPEDVAWSRLITTEGSRNVILHAEHGDIRSFLRCSLDTGACDRILTDLPAGAVLHVGAGASVATD